MKSSNNMFWTGKCAENAQIHITRLFNMSLIFVDWQEMIHYVDDALGVCAVLSSFPLKPPIIYTITRKLSRQRTGSIWMKEGLKKVYRRNRSLSEPLM